MRRLFILFGFALLLSFTYTTAKATTIITTECSIAGDSTVCENQVETYSSGYGGSFTYLWNVFGGTISGSNTSPTVTVNWGYAGTGQLSVIVKDSLGAVVCTKLINIVISPAPTPEIMSSSIAGCRKDHAGQPDGGGPSCELACDSSWVNYYTALNPGSTYTWVITGSATYTTSGNEVDVYWSGIGVGTVQVIETNSFGCVGTTEICIEIIEKPTALFTTIPSAVFGTVTVCLGQDIYFFNQSTDNGGSAIESYEWVFGDGSGASYFPPDSGHTSHAYSTGGTYTVYLIVTNECGCADTAELEVNVLDEPGPDIACISTVCPGSVMTYSTSASCPDYLWSTNANGTIIGSATSNTVTVQWGSSAPAILTLDVDSCGGYCPVPSNIVVPLIPANAAIAGDTLVCQYTCNTYKISCDIPIDSIIWHVPAGFTAIGDTINVHELTLCASGGSYSGTLWVEYFHTTNGSTQGLSCGGNAYLPIHVRPNMSLLGEASFCENESFTFSVPGTTGNISWAITDNTGATTYAMSILPIASPFTGSWFWGAGTFVVTATDLSNNFCNPEVSKIVIVNPSPPSPTILGEDSVCPNSTHNYSAILSNSNHTTNWTIVGGTPSSAVGNSINVTWNPSGPYIVYAQEVDPLTNCPSDYDTLVVQSLLPLSPAIIEGPDTICSNSLSNFYTNSPGDTYYWSINSTGMGSISNGQYTNAVEIQTNNVTGNAWLVLERSLCSQTVKDSIAIVIIAPPTPSITAPSTICENETFSVSSSTSAVLYSWDFGDGNSGVGSSDSHTYTSPGAYVITLTVVYGGSCAATVTTFANITVDPAPTINISTADPTTYCNPVTSISTTMTAAASLDATICTWYKYPGTSLGSGSTLTATSTGTYFMVCSNALGCSDTSNFITIDTTTCPGACVPQNYALSISNFRLGCNTDSLVYSSSNVTSQAWNFGDIYNPGSNTATGNNVTHTYTEPGVYVIKVCGEVPAASGSGTCTVCETLTDTIDYVPDFYPVINCTDYSSDFTVTFTNITKVFALATTPTYSWKINGSGVLSTATDYTTSLSPGTYNVELIIDGVCSLVKTITINPMAQANFTASDSICEDAVISFINTSTGTFVSPEWDFGDGASSLLNSPVRAYANSGNYTVSLTITNEHGCKDSIHKDVVVLPNTLDGFLTLSGPNEFCIGDSVEISANTTGGYPGFTYLWTNTASTQSITAYYTGNYGVQIWDAKQCYTSVPDTVVKVNPLPNTEISGPSTTCLYSPTQYSVPITNAEHTITWTVNNVTYSFSNQFEYFPTSIGTDTIIVNAVNSYGCESADTIVLTVFGLPNVSIVSSGSLCGGDTSLLVAKSTSTNLVSMQWSNGTSNDSLYTTIPGVYTVTVTDSNGCTAQASSVIHELPDFCGLMTGCYEICDTVTELVWYAPTGYASYQWYYNGVAMAGSVYDTVHIPLYQSGIYTVIMMNSDSCYAESDPIDISFVHCGDCEISADVEIDCNPVDQEGHQTYSMTFTVNSSLPDGSNIAISSADGAITGLSTSTVNNGSNLITATFTDIGAIDTIVCFHISIWDSTQRCDTVVCDTLPNCECTQSDISFNSQKPFECIGYDGSGNPQYYGCLGVNWSGSSSSTLTLVAPNSSFSPNPINLVFGPQTICFTYTDLPPTNPGALLIYAYFYDSTTHQTCKDSFRITYEPCPDPCEMDIIGLCAHCEQEDENGGWTYKLEMDITNPFGNYANVSITPIAAGTFGSISPNPIPPGTSTVSVMFTDNPPPDSIICFKVTLTESHGDGLCYKDVCISLPECNHLSTNPIEIRERQIVTIYPNPTTDLINIKLSKIDNELYTFELLSPQGKSLQKMPFTAACQFNISHLPQGYYMVIVRQNGRVVGRKSVLILN